jgi:hypothetical protein
MRRSKYHPEWGESHLLSFVTDKSGVYLAVHADLAGITMLIDELEGIRAQLERNDCPHTHLFANVPRAELTTTKLSSSEEANIVQHVKIYGWTEEWAAKHQLKTLPDE